MPRVSFDFDHRRVSRSLRRLEKRVPLAGQMAVNRVLPKVRTTASEEVRKDRNLRANFVKRQVKVLKASRRARIRGKVYAFTTAPPVELFKGTKEVFARGRVRRGQSRRRLGVQLEVIPGERHILQNAYITDSGRVYDKGSNGQGRGRRLFGPSVATSMRKPKVIARLQQRAAVELPPEIQRQYARQIARSGLKRR